MGARQCVLFEAGKEPSSGRYTAIITKTRAHESSVEEGRHAGRTVRYRPAWQRRTFSPTAEVAIVKQGVFLTAFISS
ncbi:MAG: hypothetical protein CCU27_10040 [Nitrospira sp. UW-LDO-02]|jgi:hypothetical protein|nr:MAG: hypothetical protein CCU27_10040 [Nitrospira sp. UW-LDO-02]